MKQLKPKNVINTAEDSRTASNISRIIVALIVTGLIIILFGAYLRDLGLIIVVASAIVLDIVPYALLKRGYLGASRFSLLILTLVAVTSVATIGQGIRDISIVAFPIFLFVAGFNLKRRILALYFAFTLVAAGWLIFGEHFGWYSPKPFGVTSVFAEFIILAMILFIGVLAVDFLSANLRNSFDLAKRENTERKQAEAALLGLNEDLNVAQRLTKIGNWKWVIATNTTTWSKELCNINGWDSERPVPPFAEMSSFYTEESWKRQNEAVTKALNTGVPYELELHQVRTDGTMLTTFSRGEADYDNKGQMVRLHGTVQDITQRKKAEAENQHLREKAEINHRLAAVGEMAAGIAHEINNPLTGVIGFSELLLTENLPPEIKEQLQIIADGSHRVKDIVKRMLTFARQTKSVKSANNVNELIDNTLEIRSYVLKTANIEVIRDYEPSLPWITVDPGQLQQVFLNLIVNAEFAMKKAHDKGTLTITTEKKDGHIRISFKDDGPGMSPEIIKKLFNPFFTTKDPGEGTGLGLSLSRSIILEHGGSIEVESEPGQGANFIITLPVTPTMEEAIPETTADSTTPPEKVRAARILVVDDEDAIRSLLSKILVASGHTVDTTGEPNVVLLKLENTSYDVVLLDIRMPDLSGMELYYKIILKHPELARKVIFITGDTSDLNIRDYLKQHDLPYISKPFDRATLLEKVNGLL